MIYFMTDSHLESTRMPASFEKEWRFVHIKLPGSLTLPLYIEVPVPSQESERSYI
jgi:hypothetical protein